MAAARVQAQSGATLLDVGCADRGLAKNLPEGCQYIGLDYPATGACMYGARVDVFGDGQALPFSDSSIDSIALLDVMEHMAEPIACLREAARVLKPEGKLFVHVPFMYPLHDEPYDFQRPTEHALRLWAEKSGLTILELEPWGTPTEAAALLANLALAGSLVRLTRRHAWLIVLLPLLPLVSLVSNVLGSLGSLFTRRDHFSPISYWIVAQPSDLPDGKRNHAQ